MVGGIADLNPRRSGSKTDALFRPDGAVATAVGSVTSSDPLAPGTAGGRDVPLSRGPGGHASGRQRSSPTGLRPCRPSGFRKGGRQRPTCVRARALRGDSRLADRVVVTARARSALLARFVIRRARGRDLDGGIGPAGWELERRGILARSDASPAPSIHDDSRPSWRRLRSHPSLDVRSGLSTSRQHHSLHEHGALCDGARAFPATGATPADETVARGRGGTASFRDGYLKRAGQSARWPVPARYLRAERLSPRAESRFGSLETMAARGASTRSPREGRRLFNSGRFFAPHEVCESRAREEGETRTPPPPPLQGPCRERRGIPRFDDAIRRVLMFLRPARTLVRSREGGGSPGAFRGRRPPPPP